MAPWLVKRTANPAVQLDSIAVDTGVVQIDSLTLDADASIAKAEEFMANFESRYEGEAAFLRAHEAVMTVSDLPPLGVAAAVVAGIPAIALGHFTWDWIYEHYRGGQAVADSIARVYRHVNLAIRLPMWGGFATMAVIRDLPFCARRSSREPLDVRRAFDIPLDARVVLASFAGIGVQGLEPMRYAGWRVTTCSCRDYQQTASLQTESNPKSSPRLWGPTKRVGIFRKVPPTTPFFILPGIFRK